MEICFFTFAFNVIYYYKIDLCAAGWVIIKIGCIYSVGMVVIKAFRGLQKNSTFRLNILYLTEPKSQIILTVKQKCYSP